MLIQRERERASYRTQLKIWKLMQHVEPNTHCKVPVGNADSADSLGFQELPWLVSRHHLLAIHWGGRHFSHSQDEETDTHRYENTCPEPPNLVNDKTGPEWLPCFLTASLWSVFKIRHWQSLRERRHCIMTTATLFSLFLQNAKVMHMLLERKTRNLAKSGARFLKAVTLF